MSINKIKKKLKENSKQDNSWLGKAEWRKKNEDWLDISFAIAVKIILALKANKKSGVYPKNQKELAEAIRCRAQYVNKLLKGAENLQLETIIKIEKILKVKLIQVPQLETKIEKILKIKSIQVSQFETTIPIAKSPYLFFKKTENIVSKKISNKNYNDSMDYSTYEPNCKKEVA